MTESSITTTTILAQTTELLERGGYRRFEPNLDSRWPISAVRLFEDPYSIVAVLAYENWRELAATWADAQATLAELISLNIRKGEPKAWDGYLVLFTPTSPGADRSEVDRIRYDVSRVRKLVGSSDDLLELDDVRRILLPLLPLETGLPRVEAVPAIEMIPSILAAKGTPESVGRALVAAFQRQDSLMETLHRLRGTR